MANRGAVAAADPNKEGKVRRENTKINLTRGPGYTQGKMEGTSAEFSLKGETAQGDPIDIKQVIAFPPGYDHEDLEITVDVPPRTEIGQPLNVTVTIVKGTPERLQVRFSHQGDNDANYRYILGRSGPLELNPTNPSFSFPQAPNIVSQDCFIQVIALDQGGSPQAYFTSNQFELFGDTIEEYGIMLTAPIVGSQIDRNQPLPIAWSVMGRLRGQNVFTVVPTNVNWNVGIGYALNNSNRQYQGMAVLRNQTTPAGTYDWKRVSDAIPPNPAGTQQEVFLRIVLTDPADPTRVIADRVFGPYSVADDGTQPPPPQQVQITLDGPGENEVVPTSICQLRWSIQGVPADFTTPLVLTYSLTGPQGSYQLIKDLTSPTRGMIRWKVPEVQGKTAVHIQFTIPDNTPFTSHQFFIKREGETPPPPPIIDYNIKLPKQLSRRSSPGTYLHSLLNDPKFITTLNAWFHAATELERIATILQLPAYQRAIGKLYTQFMAELEGVRQSRNIIDELLPMEDEQQRNESKVRLANLFDTWLSHIRGRSPSLRINQEFSLLHRKDLRSLTAIEILSNHDYVSWVLQNAGQLDKQLGLGKGGARGWLSMLALYDMVDRQMNELRSLYTKLDKARRTLAKIRRILNNQ